MKVTLALGLAGPDLVTIARRVQEVFLPNAGLPDSLYVNGKKKVTADWLEKWTSQSRDFMRAKWEDRDWIRLDPGTIVKIWVENYELDPRNVLESLSGIPFTVCSAATLFPDWVDSDTGEKYEAPSFADMHW